MLQKILVCYKLNSFLNIVIAIAANNSDLIEREQVPEDDGRKYAKEIGAIFKLTSTCTAAGIEELFRCIGYKILDPNYNEDDDDANFNNIVREEVLQQKPINKDLKKSKIR